MIFRLFHLLSIGFSVTSPLFFNACGHDDSLSWNSTIVASQALSQPNILVRTMLTSNSISFQVLQHSNITSTK